MPGRRRETTGCREGAASLLAPDARGPAVAPPDPVGDGMITACNDARTGDAATSPGGAKTEHRPRTTTDAGTPAPSDEYSQSVGPDGPLLQDHYLIQKMAQF